MTENALIVTRTVYIVRKFRVYSQSFAEVFIAEVLRLFVLQRKDTLSFAKVSHLFAKVSRVIAIN